MEPTRIRTINECLSEIKEYDPKSSLTYTFIKKLCDNGSVKHIKHGRKYFVNYDDLLSRLIK